MRRQPIFNIKPLLLMLAASISMLMVDTAAAKYYRTDQAVPVVLVHADAADVSAGDRQQAVLVDKSRQEVTLYRYDGRWQISAQWACSTGKVQGRKAIEGDRKTPEGVYFATRDVGARYLTETYGSRALPLDYPNWLDQQQGRTGSAIWIHGTNKLLKPHDSNGCVVMDNVAINDLASRVKLQHTPIVIVDRLERASIKAQRDQSTAVLAALDQWRHVLNHGSFAAFKQCYERLAQPTMVWWRQWCRQRSAYSVGPEHQSILSQRLVIRVGDTYVALFDHYLATRAHRVWAGRRKLYLKVGDDGVKIVGDHYQSRAGNTRDPLFYAWKKIVANRSTRPQHSCREKARQRFMTAG
jgi:murein L,D-transpeptidase YafK